MALEDEGTTETQPDEGLTEAQPDWLLPRFKSVEEQARSYSEAERRMTEVGADRNRLQQERDALAEQLEEARTAPTQQQQPYTQDDLAYNPLVIRAEQARAMGNTVEELRVFAEIAQAAAQQAAQQNQPPPQEPQQDLSVVAALAEQQTRAANPDYDEHEARAMEILNSNPHLFPDRTLQGVLAGTNAALNIARGEAATRDRQTVAAKQQQAEADRQRKLSAQTVEGGGQKPPPPDEQSALWEQIKNAGTGSFRLPR